jgi:hypothetical protein
MTSVMTFRMLFLAILGLFVTACPAKSVKKDSGPPAQCTTFGQRCEFSPGKLGACVVRDGCVGEGCLVCQSQH